MGYKIFYSYQSDIDSNLNKKFIRTAINNAIAKINQYNIEPLIEGFYGIGGNPPLLEKMLEQSTNADIFIGDVTFTSSKIWQSNAINFHEDSKSYLIEIDKPIDLKPAPNPNVLLETGYSWALKKFERTILVINTAFSDPSKLPVDFRGLRFPIDYKLDSTRAGIPAKHKKELDNLTNSLEYAIIDAIKSDIAYQLKMLSPFENHKRWSRLHTYPFHLSTRLKEKLVTLRESILNYTEPIRITGLAVTGKSRLAFEIFQKNEDLDYDELNETIIYYDLIGTTFNDINKAVSYLITQNQPKIVVVDNCPYDVHKKLSLQFKKTNIKLITLNTITSNSDTDNATIFIEDEISKEINQKILEEKFETISESIDFDVLNFNLEKTITLLENNLETDIKNKTIIELTKIIIDEENDPKANGAFNFLQFINTLGIVGVSNYSRKEFESIKRLYFNHTSDNYLDTIIEVLVSKKLLSQKGDFVLTFVFENELMENWWHENKNSLNEIISRFVGTGLLNRLVNRLLTLLKDENLIELKNSLFNDYSILANNEFTDTLEGSELLNKLVNDFPIEVLELLTKKIE